MGKIILNLFLLINCSVFSQSEDVVRKILVKTVTPKEGAVTQLPFWDFNEKTDTIYKFDVPFIKSKLKSKEFYKVNFTFIDDRHSSSENCLIMFDNGSKKIIMLPPKWYSGLKREFYKKFIGIKLINEKEKEQFAKDIGSILKFEDNSAIKEIIVGINLISINISSSDDIDIVQIFLKNNKVIQICRVTENIIDSVK